ncbi:hypothetical protein Sjap_009874 [Stephania japonica]|uniref:Protein kinase domain-containing protein n=1 Tax=Stephania japonica TaxID=461633 RepID=A0AAP0J7Y4_9MAGN
MEREKMRHTPMVPPTFTASKSSIFSRHLFEGFSIGVASVVVGVMFYFLVKRRGCCVLKQHRRQRVMLCKQAESPKSMRLLLRHFQMEELEKATKNFNEECLIGSGAFGNVYKGVFNGGGTLAIKRARPDSYQSAQEFRNEVELISRVKHRNLLGLMGYCEEAGGRGEKILVYEYVPNGSLLEYIVGRGGKNLTWRQRVKIAIGAAKGIAHLHEGVNPSIIHRDIKPSNILVGDGFEAKVSDFGLVKSGPIGDQSHVSSQIKGTPGYIDPAYCSSFHLSPFSDVYSFGVILLQLVAARPAVDTTQVNLRYHIIEWARPSIEKGNVEEILDVRLLSEPCNIEMMLKMAQLGMRCVVKAPKNRPTMTNVWEELEEALYSTDNLSGAKQSLKGDRRSTSESHSSVSLDGIGLQKFHIEMDKSISFQSTSLRCLEDNSVSIELDKNNLEGISEGEGTSTTAQNNNSPKA